MYIRTVRSRNRKYRYLVIEEYLGNGKRKTLLSIPVDEAIKILLWCGGWDLNPRRPTPSGPQPHGNKVVYWRSNGFSNGFQQHSGSNVPVVAEKLGEFYMYCRQHASGETCKQYLRYLSRPLDNMNRWSITAYKKYYRWLCEKGVEEACILFKKIKSKKSGVDKYVPGLEEVSETIAKAEEPYSTVFRILLYTGLRLREAVYLLRNIDKLKKTRLDGFYRIEIALERGPKKSFVAYTPVIPDRIIITDREVSEYSRKNKLLAPKYFRKFVSTQMAKLGIPENVIDFIQGRTPDKIIRKHYLNLLALADQYYKKYVEWLRIKIHI